MKRVHLKVLKTGLVSSLLVVLQTGCAPFSAKSVDMISLPGPSPASNQDASGKPFKFVCSDPSRTITGEGALQRLTKDELSSTLKDLLGPNVHSKLEIELLTIPSDTVMNSVSEVVEFHSSAHAEAYLELAVRAANLAVNDPALMGEMIKPCTTMLTESCFVSFVDRFGLRAHRRPLTAQEKESYLQDFRASGANVQALELAVSRMLLSADFLFHLELGGAPTGTKARLTDYEIASRLSYRLIGSMPDAALLGAAQRGELQTIAGVTAQAKRLLATPSGQSRVMRFFDYWMKLDYISNLQFSEAFKDGIDTTGLREEMVAEAQDFVRYIVWTQNGKFSDLMTSTASFAKSERMARIYGTPVAASARQPAMATNGRAGILMRAATLVSGHEHASPIMRGVNIRKRILCDELVSPNEEIINNRTKDLGSLDRIHYSNRQIVAKLTEPTSCMGCHSSINSLGFAFEGYDSLGRQQSKEMVFDMTGKVVATHPVDTSVEDLNLERSQQKVPARDALDLVEAIADSSKGPACFAQQLFQFSRTRVNQAQDLCALAEIERAARNSNGNLLDVFVANVANEDIFWKKYSN